MMGKDTPLSTVTITVVGTGAEADQQARALRGADGVAIERLAGASEDELLESLSRGAAHAVAFASPAPDLPNAIKRAVMAGRHVFVPLPVALSSRELRALDGLAARRQRVILFDNGSLGDERLAFVRKMTGGQHALWRPRYIRSLRTGAHGSATLDELAVADLGVVLAAAGGTPSRVSAFAPRVDDETGAADAAMVTLSFDGGSVAQLDVSLIEPMLRREVAIACDGRTIVLDAFDQRAPLQIQAAARHRGPQASGQWAETVSERPLGDAGDRVARAAAAFVDAVRTGDAAATNAAEMADAALVWETARESMARGGELLSLAAAGAYPEAKRPALQLIRGGGRRVDDRPAPELTLVARGEHPPRSA
jgi:predicted dehydrogenase